MRRLLPLLLALLFPAIAAAEVEIVPFGGYSSTSVDSDSFFGGIDARDGALYGLAVAVGLHRSLLLEARWSHQESDITFDPNSLALLIPIRDFDIDTVHIGLQKEWDGARLKPFVAFGAGGTRLRSETQFQSRHVDRVSAALGGGLKIDLIPHLALQLEARGVWIDLPEDLGSELLQLTLGSGVVFRF